MEDNVILVDKDDNEIGTEEKMRVHKEGKLHRAISVFVVNSKGELLIQKRVKDKYHSAGLWANTCCSHPFPGEDIERAAHRRLKQEFGFDCKLEKIFSFIYKVKFENGLTEYEFDHVFFGKFDGNPKPYAKEIGDWEWINLEQLKEDIRDNPSKYAYWLKESIGKFTLFVNKAV